MADRAGSRRRSAAATASARSSSKRQSDAASNEPSTGSSGRRDREQSADKVAASRKRGRAQDEDEETKDSEPPSVSEASGRRSRAGVDTAADDAFLEALVVFKPRMDSGERKYPIWDEIAALFPERFRGGRSAKGRFEWLRQVAQDESHGEHGKISPGMQEKIRFFDSKPEANGEEKGVDDAVEATAKKNEAKNDTEDRTEATGAKEVSGANEVAETGKRSESGGAEVTATKPKSPKKRRRSVFTDPAAARRKRRRDAQNAQLALAEDEPEKEAENEPEKKVKEKAKEKKAAVQSDAKSKERGTNAEKPKPIELGSADNIPAKDTMEARPTNHRQTEFNPQLEEIMMRIVLDYAPKLAAAARKMDVWNEIARYSRGRYGNGNGARCHVAWLLKSSDDPSHRIHKLVTPTLRVMLDKFKALYAKSSFTAESSTPEDVGQKDTAVHDAIDSRVASPKVGQTKPTSTEIRENTTSSTSDEALVRLVMSKQPFAVSSAQKAAVWDEIAAGVQQVDSAMVDGTRALERFNWLASVFSHQHHATLTESLWNMLGQYFEMTAAYHAKSLGFKVLNEDEKETTADSVSAAVAGSDTVGRDATIEELRIQAGGDATIEELQIQTVSDRSKPEHTSGSVAHEGVGGEVVRAGAQKTSSPSDLVNEESDLALMQALLRVKPFLADRKTRSNLWRELLDIVRPVNPMITTAIGAFSRVRWLLTVAENPSHAEYRKMTTELRNLLLEYREMDEAAKNKGISNVLSINLDVADDEDRGSGSDPIDDLLLRELLRLRPFHAKTGMGVWKQVMRNVNRAAGAKVYPSPQPCLERMKKLLAASRSPSSRPGIELSKTQQAMIKFVDALLKIRWPSTKARLTSGHKAILSTIQKFLAKKFSSSEPMKRPSAPKADNTKTQGPTTTNATTAEPATYFNRVEALQNQIVELRTVGAQNRVKYDFQIKSVQERVAKCRAKLEERAEAMDRERSERRAEIRELMDLLKEERSMHAREKATMLEVIAKERIDRRQEFVSLMSLVTRAVLPPTQQTPVSTE